MAKKPTQPKRKFRTAKLPADLSGSVFRQLPNVRFFTLDKRYCYISFSQAYANLAKRILGITVSKGISVLDVIKAPKQRAQVKKRLDIALKGKTFARILRYSDKQGRGSYHENTYGPIKNKQGKIVGLYVLSQDVTKKEKKNE